MSSVLDRQRAKFRANPSDRGAFEALEEALFVAGAWDELARVIETRLLAPELQADPRGAARLLFRLGQILEDRCDAADRAADCWRRAAALDPACRPALSGLRLHASARGDWALVLQIAEAELELEMTRDEAAALRVEVARIWSEELEDPEQALVQLRATLKLDPTHRDARHAAVRASLALESWAEAADHLAHLGRRETGERRIAAARREAELRARLGQRERAVELYRALLEVDDSDATALWALARHAEDEESWPSAASLYERHFEGTPEPAPRSAAAAGVARARRALGDLEGARSWLLRATELDGDALASWRALADVERARENDAGLRRALSRALELGSDAAQVSELLELATLHSDSGDDAAAVPLLERALERAPEDALVLEALTESLTQLGRWDALADCLERRAALATPDAASQASGLVELGAVCEEHLDDDERACRSYERALELDAGCSKATGALERLYRKTEQWAPLRALLERAARECASAQRPARLCALADLLAGAFDDAEGARRVYANALTADPECVDAHRGIQRLCAGDADALFAARAKEAAVTRDPLRLGALVEALIASCEAMGDPETAIEWAERWWDGAPECRAALEQLARLQRELGRTDDHIASLERLDLLLPTEEQVSNRKAIARLHAEVRRTDAAIAAYRGCLELAPGDLDALRALAVLLDACGRPEELACVRRDLAGLTSGPERVVQLDALAEILAMRLGDEAGAIDTLQVLAELDGAPPDTDARLERLLASQERNAELAEQLARRAARSDAETARALSLQRATLLLDALDDPTMAARLFREALDADADDADAANGLERALRAAHDAVELATFLSWKAERLTDVSERSRARLEQAELLHAIGSHEAAAAALRRVAEEEAAPRERSEAADRLESLYTETESWNDLRVLLEAELERADGGARIALHEKLGHFSRDRLRDLDAAARHWSAVAEAAPSLAEPWRELARIHEEAGRPEDVAHAMEAELLTHPDAVRELSLCRRLAALWSDVLGEPTTALKHLERVAELDPSDGVAAETLIAHWESEGRFDEVVGLLERRRVDRTAEGEADERTSLRLRIAELRAERLGDLAGAIDSLEAGVREVGAQSALAEPLAAHLAEARRIEDLVALSRAAIAEREPGADRARWALRLADALRALDREQEAADAYCMAQSDGAADAEVEPALRELHRRLGHHEPLARLLERMLLRMAGPEEIPPRMELADLLLGELGRPEEALIQLKRVVQLDPGHGGALVRALEVAEQTNRDDFILGLLEDALARPLPPTERAALLARRGNLLARDPEHAHRAASDLREALTLDASRRDVLEALIELLERERDWEAALGCLRQLAKRATPRERIGFLERGGEIAWQHVGPEAAVPWLEQLLASGPGHATAAGRLAEAHRTARRTRERLAAVREQISRTPDGVSRRDLHLVCAGILERELDAPGLAARELAAADALCPGDDEVLALLDRLTAELGRPAERARILEERAGLAPPGERLGLLHEAARLYATHLAQPRKAAWLLLQLAADPPASAAAYAGILRELGMALRAARDFDAWARCAETELGVLDPEDEVFDERRVALHRELALHYERVRRPDAAIRHLRPIVDGDPDRCDPAGACEAALLRALRALGGRVELERRLSARLERRGGDAEGWRELARLRAERLGDVAGAAQAWRELLQTAPDDDEAIRGLRAAAERLQRWEEVVETLELELERLAPESPEARASLHRRLGDVSWRQLGLTTKASRAYAAAIEARPRDFDSHRSLQQLLEAMEDWRGALDLYESEVEVLGDADPERRMQACLRAGEIARDHLGDRARARSAFAKAAGIGELAPESALELAELHRHCGDVSAFAEAFAGWCDRADTAPRAIDHLRLAETLAALGRPEDARARAELAVGTDAGDPRVWPVTARMREACGDDAAAAIAWERAGELERDAAAAEHWCRAAELRRASEPERAAALLRKATAADPTAARAWVALARIASESGEPEEAERAVSAAVALPDAALETPERRDLALVGARAARSLDHPESAALLFEEALAADAACIEALAGAGEMRAALDDLPAARRWLERLLDTAADRSEARHRALLARCLAHAGEPEPALAQAERAIADDPSSSLSHAVCVGLHEEAGRAREGIAALERWAASCSGPERAAPLLRAAEWERSEGADDARVLQLLEAAAEADPERPEVWLALAEAHAEAQRFEAARTAAERGAACSECDARRAEFELLRGRALEASGELEAASNAFGAAVGLAPDCDEAATGQVRVLRALGSWRDAAAALERFIDRHPGGDAAAQSRLLQQLARLQAGPLEDIEGAAATYRRAIALDPESPDLRAGLAQLMGQLPDGWCEALAQYAETLERQPERTDALWAAVRIADERLGAGAARGGRALLRALGLSNTEDETPPDRAGSPLGADAGLEDRVGEAVRRAIAEAAVEIGSALGAPPKPPSIDAASSDVARFRAGVQAAESELTAPGLLLLDSDELGGVVRCVATLALAPDAGSIEGSGARLNALAEALGRRIRRRLRRALDGVTLDECVALDIDAWRAALRTCAAARAVDAGTASLRTALVTLACESRDRDVSEIAPTTEITDLVRESPLARALLLRAVRAFTRELPR